MKYFSSLLALVFCASLTISTVHAGTCNGDLTTKSERNPDSAYTSVNSLTVTDSRTGLMWQRCTFGQTLKNDICSNEIEANGNQIKRTFYWGSALQAANEANTNRFATYDDWRLPNVKELQSLVENCRSNPAININIFPGTPLDAWYWSSSPYRDNTYNRYFSWVTGFDIGNSQSFPRTFSALVRLVRNGDSAKLSVPTTQSQLSVSATGSGTISFQGSSTTKNETCISTAGTLLGTCIKQFNVAQAEEVTLTAAGSGGYTFQGWGGACGAFSKNQSCKIVMIAAQNVSALFTGIATQPSVPKAPTIVATPGDKEVSIAVTLTDNGGADVISYTSTCVAGAGAATPIITSKTSLPIIVDKLTNDTEYTCTVTATNGQGKGASSAEVKVTPRAMQCAYSLNQTTLQIPADVKTGNVNVNITTGSSCSNPTITVIPAGWLKITSSPATAAVNLSYEASANEGAERTATVTIGAANTTTPASLTVTQRAKGSVPPVVSTPRTATFTPDNDATSVAINSPIYVTFSEVITQGTGRIVLQKAGVDVPITASVQDKTLTITPVGSSTLDPDTAYTIQFPLDSVNKDASGKSFPSTTVNFRTAPQDILPPKVVGSPVADFVSKTIAITFSKTIYGVSGINILVNDTPYDAAGADRNVQAGSTLTITEPALTPNTSYTVKIPADALRDDAGRYFAGGTYPVTNSGSQTTTINGTSSNDTLTDLKGDNTIDGGAGIDTAVFTGNLANYTVTKSGSSYTVTDTSGGGYGINTVTNIELLKFDDKTVNLTIQAKAAAAPPADVTRLVELYVAFFNRVPDADGLAYWIDQLKGGQSMAQIADSFYAAGVAKPDLTGFSASMTDAEFVRVIYKNVLGRSGTTAPPDADVANWANNLATKADTRGSLINTILGAAHGYKNDATWGWVPNLLDNKIAVAKTFAIDWGLNYPTADQNITEGMKIAAVVTATDTAVALATAGIASNQLKLN